MNEPADEFNMGVKQEAQLGDIVDFEGDSDTLNPQNWPMGKRVYTTALLLIFGFVLGPMLWAPLCQVYVRKWPALAPCFISAAFAFGTATAKDIQTILITRFFTGVFGSSPISITGGSIVDIWTPRQRGTPMVCYSITIAAAPTLGPIIDGAFIASGCGWRWTEYLTGIVIMVQFVLDAVWLDESHFTLPFGKPSLQCDATVP
ncbi:hypothetical protein EAE99_006926 [Botrytis elliptica]|nr:hypothetical protein EAE99_006926 [Botrytis elliptica]